MDDFSNVTRSAALGAKEGPFRLLVAPHEKRPASWVRMLQSITVAQVP